MNLRTRAAVVAAGAIVLLACAPVIGAASWRTALIASNEDKSDFAFFYDINRTTLAKVNGLRLRSSSTMPVKIDAEVRCKKGASEASRKVPLAQVSGTRTRPLPVPVRGGRCTVELSVQATDSGRYDLLLQYQ